MKKDAKQIIEKHFMDLLKQYKEKAEKGESLETINKVIVEVNDIVADIKLLDKSTPKEFTDLFLYWISNCQKTMSFDEQVAAGNIKIVRLV